MLSNASKLGTRRQSQLAVNTFILSGTREGLEKVGLSMYFDNLMHLFKSSPCINALISSEIRESIQQIKFQGWPRSKAQELLYVLEFFNSYCTNQVHQLWRPQKQIKQIVEKWLADSSPGTYQLGRAISELNRQVAFEKFCILSSVQFFKNNKLQTQKPQLYPDGQDKVSIDADYVKQIVNQCKNYHLSIAYLSTYIFKLLAGRKQPAQVFEKEIEQIAQQIRDQVDYKFDCQQYIFDRIFKTYETFGKFYKYLDEQRNSRKQPALRKQMAKSQKDKTLDAEIQKMVEQAKTHIQMLDKIFWQACTKQSEGFNYETSLEVNDDSSRLRAFKIELFRQEMEKQISKSKRPLPTGIDTIYSIIERENQQIEKGLASVIREASYWDPTKATMIRTKCIFNTVNDLLKAATVVLEKIRNFKELAKESAKENKLNLVESLQITQIRQSQIDFKQKGQDKKQIKIKRQVVIKMLVNQNILWEIKLVPFFAAAVTEIRENMEAIINGSEIYSRLNTLVEWNKRTAVSYLQAVRDLIESIPRDFNYLTTSMKNTRNQQPVKQTKKKIIDYIGKEYALKDIEKGMFNRPQFFNLLESVEPTEKLKIAKIINIYQYYSHFRAKKNVQDQIKDVQYGRLGSDQMIKQKKADYLYHNDKKQLAEKIYLELKEQAKKKNSIDVSNLAFKLGMIYQDLDEDKLARELYEQVTSQQMKLQVYINLGIIQKNLDAPQKALEKYRQAEDIIKNDKKYSHSIRSYLAICNNIGNLYFQQIKDGQLVLQTNQKKVLEIDSRIPDSYVETYQHYQKVQKFFQLTKPTKPQDLLYLANCLNNLGLIFRMNNRKSEVTFEKFKKSLQLKEIAVGRQSLSYTITLTNIGIYYEDTGQIDKALHFYEQCYYLERACHPEKESRDTLYRINKIYSQNQRLVKYHSEISREIEKLKKTVAYP